MNRISNSSFDGKYFPCGEWNWIKKTVLLLWRTISFIKVINEVSHFFCNWRRCLFLGGAKKLYRLGTVIRDIIKTEKTLKEANIPNSTKIGVLVTTKVAKPAAVVVFVNKIAFPVFVITLERAFCLFPWERYSWWYLLIKKTQLINELFSLIN